MAIAKPMPRWHGATMTASAPPTSPQRGGIDKLALVMLGGTMLFWAGNFIVARYVRGDVPPIMLALLRWVLATLLLLPFAWRGFREDLPALLAGWRALLVLGIAGVGGFNTFAYMGLQYTTAINGLLVQATIPGMVLLIGAIVLRRREPALRVAGIGLSMLGAMFTIFRGDVHALLGLDLGRGDVLVFVGCVLWAIYTVALRFAPEVRPASLLLASFLIGVATIVPVALLTDQPPVHWTAVAVGGVAYVAIFPSVIAYFLYNAGVARAGPAIAGQAITLMPPVGAVLAALLLAEPLHWYHGVGLALILAGIVLSVRSDLKRS